MLFSCSRQKYLILIGYNFLADSISFALLHTPRINALWFLYYIGSQRFEAFILHRYTYYILGILKCFCLLYFCHPFVLVLVIILLYIYMSNKK